MITFILKRILQMLSVLLVVSIISFIIINLPPGDFLTVRIIELEALGDIGARERLTALTERFGLDRPIYEQYFIWITNFVQGDFGRSFEHEREVSELIGDRILMTVILAASTIVFTWIVAIPIGIYAAKRQYSIGDNILSLIGFVGLATPSFLLALILMYIAVVHFGHSPAGLFSPEFEHAPWSISRVLDLLSHLWIPVIILGTAGTAGLIRIMRGNLLDVLGQAFVRTARAKGLRERLVVYKHAVRVAINPLITIAGMQLPVLISGEAIVANILNLPTMGPMFLRALLVQDMHVAGTLLVFMALLLMIGNLVADIALAMADPRIRVN